MGLVKARLLGFDIDMLAIGASAIRLAGQRRFAAKSDDRSVVFKRDSLCWPYSASAVGNTLVVTDRGYNRVLLWEAAS